MKTIEDWFHRCQALFAWEFIQQLEGHISMMLTSASKPSKREANVHNSGYGFIGGSGLFRHILNYLRDDRLPLGLSRADRTLLLQEAAATDKQQLVSRLVCPLPHITPPGPKGKNVQLNYSNINMISWDLNHHQDRWSILATIVSLTFMNDYSGSLFKMNHSFFHTISCETNSANHPLWWARWIASDLLLGKPSVAIIITTANHH